METPWATAFFFTAPGFDFAATGYAAISMSRPRSSVGAE
jgi:hypothetical protein